MKCNGCNGWGDVNVKWSGSIIVKLIQCELCNGTGKLPDTQLSPEQVLEATAACNFANDIQIEESIDEAWERNR